MVFAHSKRNTITGVTSVESSEIATFLEDSSEPMAASEDPAVSGPCNEPVLLVVNEDGPSIELGGQVFHVRSVAVCVVARFSGF